MPEDWDEEEDGEFEPPQVPNPACTDGPGCGVWVRPTIPNPDYKGKWVAPLIDNPEYVGVWEPRQIDNPHFFEDTNPHRIPAMSAVAIEIWTMSGGIEFDDIIVSNNEANTLEYGREAWSKEHNGIKETQDSQRKSAEREAREAAYAEGGLIDKVNYFVFEAFEYTAENPVAAVATGVVLLVSLIACCCMGGGSNHSHSHGGHDTGIHSDDEDTEDEDGSEAGEDEDAVDASGDEKEAEDDGDSLD